jgi:aspartate-semialdehyde dehydrogenase
MSRKKRVRVALVGPDTFRGKEVKEVLEEKKFPLERIDFFDPDVKEAYSKLTEFQGEPRVVLPLDKELIEGSDFVFLAADSKTNRSIGHLAAKKRFMAIDLNETFNREKKIPLVVAGVNDRTVLQKNPSLIANPHPVTIILSHILSVIIKKFNLVKAVVFVLQPVSAFDDSGIEELASQSFAVLNGAAVTKNTFRTQVAFNLLSHTESPDKDGFSPTEKQILSELGRVLGIEDLPLSLSIIQAPVFHTYSIMLHLELDKRAGIQDIVNLFSASPNFKVSPPSAYCPVSSVHVAGEDKIFVGQIKKETARPNTFWVWAVADNLTRGSAVNALEILQDLFLSS